MVKHTTPARGRLTGVSRWKSSVTARALSALPGPAGAPPVRVPRHREDPAVAARRAGDRGVSARPMGPERRVAAYANQNGRAGILTPRQRRRAVKKARQAYVHNPTRATGSPEGGVSL